MMAAAQKIRLDKLMVDRGIVASREKARALIMAGDVLVGDVPASKAGTAVSPDVEVRLRRPPHPYASRGGVKLRGALDAFAIELDGKAVVDIGSSTGGFTDCALQAGARKVYAVDVDTSQLDWKLATDSRVRQVEGNARYFEPAWIGDQVDLVAIDVSFISVTRILPALARVPRPFTVIVLVKPQFELGRGQVGPGGIVTDPRQHREAVDAVRRAAEECGFRVRGETPSPIKGKEGNQEFFLHLELA